MIIANDGEAAGTMWELSIATSIAVWILVMLVSIVSLAVGMKTRE